MSPYRTPPSQQAPSKWEPAITSVAKWYCLAYLFVAFIQPIFHLNPPRPIFLASTIIMAPCMSFILMSFDKETKPFRLRIGFSIFFGLLWLGLVVSAVLSPQSATPPSTQERQ